MSVLRPNLADETTIWDQTNPNEHFFEEVRDDDDASYVFLAVPSFKFQVVYGSSGTFTLPIAGGGAGYNHNFTVNWGDGTPVSTVTSYDDPDRIHTYAGAGTYDITMTGTCEWFAFQWGGDRQRIRKLLSFVGDIGFKVLNFYGCDQLNTIVPLGPKASLTTANYMFGGCTLVTSIPSRMFAGCPAITTFRYTFQLCTGLTSLPADLFRYNTLTTQFAWTFVQCTNLTSLPADLFRYNINATGIDKTFNTCTALASLPADLFRYNINVTRFDFAFASCSSLTSLPVDLFRYNINVTNFASTFLSCTGLTSLPTDLLRYNTIAWNFDSTFLDCRKLQLNDNIFWGAGERDTRFHDQSINFSQCFYRNFFTGTQGTAPDLWNCDFGIGTPTKTSCFAGSGNTTLSLTNYADIPVAWK